MTGCHEARNMVTIREVRCPQCGEAMEVLVRDGDVYMDSTCEELRLHSGSGNLSVGTAMRLERIQDYLRCMGYPYQYWEFDGCGTIEFEHRGLHYHIWEYPESECGAESNLASAGRSIEYSGDYESELLAILKSWEGSW